MTQIVLLDSTPVGLITNPKATPVAGSEEYPVIVATSNPKHVSLFVDARDWQDI